MLFSTNPKKIYKRELAAVVAEEKLRSSYKMPSFDLGLNYLNKNLSARKENLGQKIKQYLKQWFNHPKKFLYPRVNPPVKHGGGYLSFPSLLSPRETARFKYAPSFKKAGRRKAALIILMHWNGRLKGYQRAGKLIADVFLPVETFIHVPAGVGPNPGMGDPPDYKSVSPNVGRTVFKARQDIQDICYLAKHLKKNLGFEEVGLLTFSLGSMKGIIAASVNPELFDFAIFHLAASNYFQAMFHGLATRQIAEKIKNQADPKLIESIWKMISPGAYEKFFKGLPKRVRIVQARYDYVFWPKNVREFSKKIRKQRPDIELETIAIGHDTIGDFPRGWEMLWEDAKFFYHNTKEL